MNVDDQELHSIAQTCKPRNTILWVAVVPDARNHQLACMYSQTAFIMRLLCVYYAFIVCSFLAVMTHATHHIHAAVLVRHNACEHS
jgi:hypothetical protein